MEVFQIQYVAKSKAFCAFIEAEIVHVTSVLPACNQTEVMVMWFCGFCKVKKKNRGD